MKNLLIIIAILAIAGAAWAGDPKKEKSCRWEYYQILGTYNGSLPLKIKAPDASWELFDIVFVSQDSERKLTWAYYLFKRRVCE